jgi:DNA-binding NarL/FixJ family response regulator
VTADRGAAPTRILLVDDQPLFRGAIASLINGEPDLMVVGEAENGLEGVEKAATLRPDLVVMDVEMPVMNGVEATRRIREQQPSTKVVVLTVSDADEHVFEAIRIGAHGYLLKDLRPEQLFDMIRSVLRHETALSPAIAGRLVAEFREGGAATRVASPEPPPEEPSITKRELEILQLVAEGLSNKEIGKRLWITEGTVKNHVHNALEKLHMTNRIQAAAYIVRQGLGRAKSED